MDNSFTVRGLDSRTGRIVETAVQAESAAEAARLAESAGMERPVVSGPDSRWVRAGKVRTAVLLWALGVPIPLVLLFVAIRGCV